MIIAPTSKQNGNDRRPKIQCIYKISNLHDNAVYIGSTNNFSKRYKEHRHALMQGHHSSKAMQAAFERGDPLDMSIIEDCTGMTRGQLLMRESEYIAQYNSIQYGYNTTIPTSRRQPAHETITNEADTLRRQLDTLRADHAAELDAIEQKHSAELDDLRQRIQRAERLRADCAAAQTERDDLRQQLRQLRQERDDGRQDCEQLRAGLRQAASERDALRILLEKAETTAEQLRADLTEERQLRWDMQSLIAQLAESSIKNAEQAQRLAAQAQRLAAQQPPTLWGRICAVFKPKRKNHLPGRLDTMTG